MYILFVQWCYKHKKQLYSMLYSDYYSKKGNYLKSKMLIYLKLCQYTWSSMGLTGRS